MALEGYGNFARLPRELRDKIYEDYFAVTNQDYCFSTGFGSRLVSCRSSSDRSLLRASRALYEETLPIWRRNFTSHIKYRAIADINFYTSSTKRRMSAPGTLRPVEVKSLTLVSPRWIYQPQLCLRKSMFSSIYYAPQIGIVYRDIRLFFGEDPNRHSGAIQSLAAMVRREMDWGAPLSVNLTILKSNLPIKVPGTETWYERLHRGMTRRSLIQAKDAMIRQFAEQLTLIIRAWQPSVQTLNVTFADKGTGRGFHTDADFDRLMELSREMLAGVVTRMVITRYDLRE